MLYRRFTIISLTLLGSALLASQLLNQYYSKINYLPLFYTASTHKTLSNDQTDITQLKAQNFF